MPEPFALALPITAAAALAATLSYVSATTSLPYDLRFLTAYGLAIRRDARLQKQDRLNLFYTLEANALEPRIADLTFLVFPERVDGQELEQSAQHRVDEGKGEREEKKRKRKRKVRSWTFRETHESVLRYAGWLKGIIGSGIGEDAVGTGQERMVIAMDFTNSPAFVFLWFAIWSLGAVPAFINSHLGRKGLVQSVRRAEAHLVIVEDEVWQSILGPGTSREREAEVLMELEREFAAPEVEGGAARQGAKVIPFDLGIRSSMPYQAAYRAPDSARANTQSRDPGILISTSGTTGPPKQAIVSWGKVQKGAYFSGKWLGLRPATHKLPDRVYCCMPLYHSSAAIIGMASCLVNTTTMVISHRFSTTAFWDEVRDTQATAIQYVGEMCRYLVSNPAEPNPHNPSENMDRQHNVRMAFGNGMRPDVWSRFKERFGIETIAEFYSATESNGGSWNLSRNDFSAGAVGRNGSLLGAMAGRQACIVQVDFETETPVRDADRDGLCVEMARGSPGELLYRLDPRDIEAAYQGYFKDQASSEKKIIRNVRQQGDAWFRTGDVMRWDQQGRWWFVDRLGDTFRWKSENVSTADVSQEIGMHPAIQQANVYGVQIPGHEGRAGCAAIILHPASDDSNSNDRGVNNTRKETVMTDLPTFLASNLPKYSIPLFLRLVKHMPQTGTLKQQKHGFKNEGLDLDLIEGRYGEELWWLSDSDSDGPRGARYVRFQRADWDRMVGGRVRL